MFSIRLLQVKHYHRRVNLLKLLQDQERCLLFTFMGDKLLFSFESKAQAQLLAGITGTGTQLKRLLKQVIFTLITFLLQLHQLKMLLQNFNLLWKNS